MGGSQSQQSGDLSERKKAREEVRSQCFRRGAALCYPHPRPRGLEAKTAHVQAPVHGDSKGAPVRSIQNFQTLIAEH